LRDDLVTDQTSLSVFCNYVIEAGWIAIAVVVPLFFNIYSYRSFEPDKVALMRSIVLVMALAWVIKALETGDWKLTASFRYPIISIALPPLLLASVYILTTITSIVPRSSLWGSYHRLQGTYTTLSYIVIFFLTLYTLHTRRQFDRLIVIILLTSLPISLYGIIQHYGLDPIAWSNIGDKTIVRAISTMGNPIFVAAFLIMVIPLTMGQLARTLSTISDQWGKEVRLYILVGCYFFLLTIQLLCIFFTQSRGPLLALMGGAFSFFLLLAASRGQRRLVLAVIGAAVALGLLLIALNLPHTPLESIRKMPFGRMAGVFSTESRTVRQRILAWEGVVNLIAANPIRAVIGYGPESMMVAFNPYFPPDLAPLLPNATFDRAHNETLDVLATTGFIGFAAYLFLFGSIFYYGLKHLGLIKGSWHRNLFILLYLGGGFAGGLLPWLLEGKWRFAGVGIPAGIIAALVTYLIIYILQPQKKKAQKHRDLLLISLISAVVAHFIEIQFGIAIAATRTYFWIYAALMLVLGSSLEKESPLDSVRLAIVPAKNYDGRHSKWSHSKWEGSKGSQTQFSLGQILSLTSAQETPVIHSLLVGLILATMGFNFTGNPVKLWEQGLAIVGLSLIVWFIGSVFAIVEGQETINPSADNIWGAPFLISIGWSCTFIVAHTFVIQENVANVVAFYFLYLCLTILVIAAVLLKSTPTPIQHGRRTYRWFYPPLTVGVSALIVIINLNLIKADIYYKQGLAHANSGQWDKSIALFQQALKLTPDQDFYYIFLAGASIEKARRVPDMAQRLAWLEEGRRALERARELNPLNPDYTTKLGLLHRVWGEMLVDPKEKNAHFNKALEYYRQGEALRPNSPKLFNEWGLVYYIKREYDKAIEKYRRSLTLDNGYAQTYLLLGDAYRATRDFAQAIEAYQKAIEIAPDDFRGHKNLALVYGQMGHIEAAMAEAEIARNLAPANEIATLKEFIAHLEAQGQ